MADDTIEDQGSPVSERSNRGWNPFTALRRCLWWATPLGMLLACISVFSVFWAFEPRYRAGHWVEARNDYLVYEDVTPRYRDLSNTERALIFSPIVMDPVLSDPSLRNTPSLSDPASAEANLRENLFIEEGGTSTRMVISYEDTDPNAAAEIVNAVAESYLRTRDSFDNLRVDNLVKWLQPELRRQEQRVREKQLLVNSLKRSVLGLPKHLLLHKDPENLRLSLLTNLSTRIANTKLEFSLLDARLSVKKRKSDSTGLTANEEDAPSDESRQGMESIAADETEREVLAAELTVLQESYDEELQRLSALSGESSKLQFAEQELAIELETLMRLRKRVAEFETERQLHESVRSLAPAEAPTSPHNSFPYKRAALAGVAAFLLPLVIGLFVPSKNSQ